MAMDFAADRSAFGLQQCAPHSSNVWRQLATGPRSRRTDADREPVERELRVVTAMLFKKKLDSTATPPQILAARNFEIGIADQARRSERNAWRVATGACVLSLLLAAGYLLVMPLKEQIPYLVLADPYRGTSSVARLDRADSTLTSSEALARSNVAHFVIARESYDWELLNRTDGRVVHSMASGSALKEYQALYAPGNPDNPDAVYGRNTSIRVKILSTVLTWNDGGAGKGAGPRAPIAASVRFERWLFDKGNGKARQLDTRLATLKVGYDQNLQMNDEGRIANPLGFRVYNYRVDPDAMSDRPASAGGQDAAAL